VDKTFEIFNCSLQEVLIEILDDSVFEEELEQFVAIGSLEGDTFDGRVSLKRSFVVVSIVAGLLIAASTM
jgi:hypothetical protein